MCERPNILIIEDEKLYLDVLIDILKANYKITIATSGQQGLDRLSKGAPVDLVLLDVLMPGIDGYQTCQQIKSNPTTRDIPVIFLTSRDDVEAETYGLSLGATDYLTKPISPSVVKARIHTHLALRNARKALEDQNLQLEQRVKERTESLRQVSSDLVLAEEKERRRIAQELHDGPTQRLVLAKMNLGRLRGMLGEAQKPTVDEVSSVLDVTLKEMRTLMVELSPPALYELGLGPAVEWLAESVLGAHQIDYRVDTAESYHWLNEELRVFLFRAVRELLLNVIKHARASKASVAINSDDDELIIEVRDDGVGMDIPAGGLAPGQNGGFGLFALQDRIDMLGGSLTFTRNGGTCAALRVPVPGAETAT